MPTIIAECCQNHLGDKALLERMVFAAAEAGADYCKIQSMLADDLVYREPFEAGVVEGGVSKAIRRPYQPEYARLKPMDLTDEDHVRFIEQCHSAGIKPLTTVFTQGRIPFLAGLPWTAIKVASYDCASWPMLRELKRRFLHLFISTGATFDHEIERTADLLGGHSFSLLHCVTIYPTPLGEMRLSRMEYLRQYTPSVGLSDHSLVERDRLKASIVALLLGAEVIERHFTILPRDRTKDGPVSIDSVELADLVRFAKIPREELQEYVEREIPEWRTMLGDPGRALSGPELLNRDYYRGRFATRLRGETVFNWEDRPAW